MQNRPIIHILTNPFNLDERVSYEVNDGSRLIDFILLKYPKGFPRPTRVFLNEKQVHLENFDVMLESNDIIDIEIQPMLTAILLVASVVVGYQNYQKLKALSNADIDVPDTITPLKRAGGNAYNLREQRNLARINEPIPTQYGRLKSFPDLAAQPYIRYVDNSTVVHYLFSLGHGSFDIEEINLGSVPYIDNESLDFTLYDPGTTMDKFDDNIIPVIDVKNTSIRSQLNYLRQYASGSFNRTNKTLTLIASRKLTQIFKEGDSITVSGNTDTEGVFDIESVTDSVITVVDSSSWLQESDTGVNILVYLTNKIYENKHFAPGFGTEFFIKECSTDYFRVNNFKKETFSIEIDLEFKDGAYIVHLGDVLDYSPIVDMKIYVAPLVDNSIPASTFINKDFEVLITSDNLTFLEFAETWLNDTDLSDVVFANNVTKDISFTEDDVLISAGDIVSIDYANATVVFNVAKTGEVKAHNTVITTSTSFRSYDIDEDYLDNRIEIGSGRTISTSVLTRVINTTATLYYEVFESYDISISVDDGIFFKFFDYDDYFEMVDQGQLKNVKVVYPNISEYPSISTLACKFTFKNNQLNNDVDNDVNILATRKLPIWNGSSWDSPVETRSIAWALADVWMSTYGASKPHSTIDLDALVALDTTWTTRVDTFDAIFDSGITVWEGLKKIARVGRCVPIFDGNVLTFVRSEIQTVHTAVYNAENILPNTFSIEYSFPDNQDPDGIRVKYLDEDDNYNPAYVDSSPNLSKNVEIDFFGCVNYNMAWRESQLLEAQLLNSRVSVVFKTEMAGHIPFVGDLISVQYDLANWGQGGQVVSKVGTTITTSQPLDWTGSPPFYMSFMKPNGSISGPHVVTQGTGDMEAILDVDVVDFTFITLGTQNPTIYQFGEAWNKPCIVKEVVPNKDNETLSLKVIPYIESIHTADVGTPDDKITSSPTGIPIPPKVGGLELTNVAESGSVVAVWNPLYGITNYKVQKSTDNDSWTDVSTPSIATETISATGLLYVRVASVISGTIGVYVKVSIIAT